MYGVLCNLHALEVTHAVRNFQFDGQGQRPTPLAGLQTTLLMLLRLRIRVAQNWLRALAEQAYGACASKMDSRVCVVVGPLPTRFDSYESTMKQFPGCE